MSYTPYQNVTISVPVSGAVAGSRKTIIAMNSDSGFYGMNLKLGAAAATGIQFPVGNDVAVVINLVYNGGWKIEQDQPHTHDNSLAYTPATNDSVKLRGRSGQTADIQKWQDFSGNDLLALDKDGRLKLKAYRETVTMHSGGVVTIDPTLSSIHRITPTGAITIQTANFADGDSVSLTINAWESSFSSITWPTIYWKDGEVPTLVANMHHWITIWASNGVLWGAYAGGFVEV